MSHVPGDLDTGRGPPMALPLRHFLVGLGFLLAGSAVGVADALGAGGLLGIARLHLLLVGWICVTIMGAMTQFVPVWSGRRLHSRRLARAQLWLVAAGVAGLALAFAREAFALAPVVGLPLLAGLWTFCYNLARTLPPVRALDATERHFALALGALALAGALGYALAAGFRLPVLDALPVARPGLVAAHATLAVFGAVVTTVVGALYQLAPMFTGTELDGIDDRLRRIEEVAYPAGVVLLAAGRLLGTAPLARAGAALLLVGLGAFAVVVSRRLLARTAGRTPMATRYAVAAAALLAWIAVTAPAWLRAPLARDALLGPSTSLLLVGFVGFVVLGTLYHVVPFIVWERRYSDLLGFEPVPRVEEMYDGRLALADLCWVAAGTGLLVAADVAGTGALALAGGAASLVGFGIAAANLRLVIRDHGGRSVPALLVGAATRGGRGDD